MNKFVFLLMVSLSILCCNNNDERRSKRSCQFKLEQLIVSDTPKVLITYTSDTLTEVKDNGKDSGIGIYTFDKYENLRFYAYLINRTNYKYSEEYDSLGNLVRKEGVPLVEYHLWKKNKDTVRFTFLLFSLNKKYKSLEVVTNKKDTIRPEYLYKSNLHTNMKCFSFDLPALKIINDLEMYTKGHFINTCTLREDFFTDTISFRDIKL